MTIIVFTRTTTRISRAPTNLAQDGTPNWDRESPSTMLFINIYRIEDVKPFSCLGVPCSDYHWMQYVDLGAFIDTGGDVVDEIFDNEESTHL
jgi:hypothetical protein